MLYYVHETGAFAGDLKSPAILEVKVDIAELKFVPKI
jgi:hypothetical protein